MPRKLTYEFVEKSFKSNGYTLLAKSYKNSRQKLNYICPKGHRGSIIWDSWKQGHRCAFCSGLGRLSINEVRDSFEREGYALLSKVYINTETKLKYRCPVGHEHYITFHNWRSGYRCRVCHELSLHGKGNPNWKGGISFEEYCQIWKDQEFKSDIKERDSHRCLNPCCTSDNPKDLVIHHIDYNKKNCHPSNLITVCRSCNATANFSREWHKAWYRAIIKNRYRSNYEK